MRRVADRLGGRRVRPDDRWGGRVGGVRERPGRRALRRVEEQLQVVAQQDVELPDGERDPDREASRERPARRGVDEREQRKTGAVQQIQAQRAGCRRTNRAPRERADRAAAILDDDADAGVVEDEVADDSSAPKTR